MMAVSHLLGYGFDDKTINKTINQQDDPSTRRSTVKTWNGTTMIRGNATFDRGNEQREAYRKEFLPMMKTR